MQTDDASVRVPPAALRTGLGEVEEGGPQLVVHIAAELGVEVEKSVDVGRLGRVPGVLPPGEFRQRERPLRGSSGISPPQGGTPSTDVRTAGLSGRAGDR
jgi:hypothetical protein